MIDYAAVKKAMRGFKASLTRAEHSGDPKKVIAAVEAFDAYFSEPGRVYPDTWHRWRVAKEEAEWKLRRESW